MERTHYAGLAGATARPNTRIDVLLWLALAVFTLFHVAASIAYSLTNGRLALSTPLFDDVSYLVDGLARLESFEQRGIAGLLASFLQNPPHAPLLGVLSTLGFAITGAEIGAYLLSGVWVLVVLGLVAHITRKLPTLERVGVLFAILSLPILNTVIGVFRPDIAWVCSLARAPHCSRRRTSLKRRGASSFCWVFLSAPLSFPSPPACPREWL